MKYSHCLSPFVAPQPAQLHRPSPSQLPPPCGVCGRLECVWLSVSLCVSCCGCLLVFCLVFQRPREWRACNACEPGRSPVRRSTTKRDALLSSPSTTPTRTYSTAIPPRPSRSPLLQVFFSSSVVDGVVSFRFCSASSFTRLVGSLARAVCRCQSRHSPPSPSTHTHTPLPHLLSSHALRHHRCH